MKSYVRHEKFFKKIFFGFIEQVSHYSTMKSRVWPYWLKNTGLELLPSCSDGEEKYLQASSLHTDFQEPLAAHILKAAVVRS
jgi:hypothetical protein